MLCTHAVAMVTTSAFKLTSAQVSVDVSFSLTCNSSGGPVSSMTWTRDGFLLDNTGPLVLTDTSTASYTNVLKVNSRAPGTYTCQIRGPSHQVLSSMDFMVQGIAPVGYRILIMSVHILQLLLPLSMCKPLRPVPLPQWRSAGVLHLVELLPSPATGSSMAMERIWL